ncbi:TetR/AcrR family transcriptional regulator [Demequina mangrovi]|uniref:Transcriptional regulator, TetR family n=1 Tax=Demequina mangrovi TaxID=1043493 RepID=A0A1H7BCP6_9MICO|nr:TetR/AcrR family transcriptional regulator [Demequina mangrovi]SEJ71175.1 transcriptional regulator, TetR family [Demequina mangrovi]
MTSASTDIDPQATSLRDRKKYLAYVAIQKAGTELIGSQGLADTTIEQIAERAGVSPRTVHRYFRTKEAVLFSRIAHPIVVKAFEDAPADVDVLTALRHALLDPMTGDTDPERLERRALRAALMEAPAVKRFAVETTEELADAIRAAALTRLAHEPDAAIKAELAAAVARFIMLTGYSGAPLEADLFESWARAMAALSADFDRTARA